MYNIIYLSEVDRNQLQELQQNLSFVQNIDEKEEILQQIEQIKEKQKPLKECNLQECNELRTEIYHKFAKLNRHGKFGIAVQFKAMLVEVEKRMFFVYQEMNKKAKEEKNKQSVDKKEISKENKSQKQAEKRNSGSRWTTGIGKLD